MRFPLLAVLVLAALLVPGPAVGRVAYVPAKPFCLVDTHIPDEAYTVEQFARTHNFSPPPGLKGNRTYRDDTHKLPALLRPYLEYDVYPATTDGRPSPRVVLSDKVPYASWYSADHYDGFVLMFPLTCVPNAASVLPRGLLGGGGT